MADYQPIPIFNYIAEHGEGPVWDEVRQKFVWVDLLKGRFMEASPGKPDTEVFEIGQALGVIGLEAEGKTVIGTRDGFGFFSRKTKKFSLIEPSPEQHNQQVRFNDGRVGPCGRFYAGTMEWEGNTGYGKLFRLNHNLTFTELDSGLSIPNGMGWNRAETHFFMIDTHQHRMFRYLYDSETGDLSEKEAFIIFHETDFADGMAMDANDNFWIAMWGGSRLDVYSPQGKKLEEIPLPVPYPTSCAFGGAGLKKLLITTSKLPLDTKDLERYPLSGKCLIVETKIKGKMEYRFAY